MHNPSRIYRGRLVLVGLLVFILLVTGGTLSRTMAQTNTAPPSKTVHTVSAARQPGPPPATERVPQAAQASYQHYLPLMQRGYTFVPGPVAPLFVGVTLAGSGAVNQTVPLTGGTLTTTDSNGTTYTLTIPGNALISPTAITMTAISAISGPPTGLRFAGGVQLEPEGLRFINPVQLRITPRTAVAKPVPFLSRDGGQEVHGYPLDRHDAGVLFNLMHFTLVYLGDGIWADVNQVPPIDSEAQFEQYQQRLLQQEHDAIAAGNPPDPFFGEKLASLYEAYYQEVIGPSLSRMTTDCFYAGNVVPRALAWSRGAFLAGLGAVSTFVDHSPAIMSSVVPANRNCWNENTKPCVNRQNASEMVHLLAIERTGLLLGDDPNFYDLNATNTCSCTKAAQVSKGWQATIGIHYNQSGAFRYGANNEDLETMRIQHEANVVNTYGQRAAGVAPYPSGIAWRGLLPPFGANVNTTGTIQINDVDRRQVPKIPDEVDTLTANAVYQNSIGYLNFDLQHCLYALDIQVSAAGTETTGLGTRATNAYDVFLITDITSRWTAATTDFTVSGSQTLPALINASASSGVTAFYPSPTFAVKEYANLDAPNYKRVGTATVTWTLTPIP